MLELVKSSATLRNNIFSATDEPITFLKNTHNKVFN